METTTRLLLPDVSDALRSDPQSVVELTEELHPADLADLAGALDEELALKFLIALPIGMRAALLEVMEHSRRATLFAEMVPANEAEAVLVAEEMAADERADMLGALPEELRARVLQLMERPEARDVQLLLAYREGTAGAIMTTEFVALAADQTTARAIDQVRKSAEEMETIYEAYAVDPNGTLLGAISLRDLVIAPAEKKIGDIMEPNVVAVDVETDQEEVARIIAKYDLLALPVIDRARRIVGIITVDDVVDVLQDEATEDVQKLGAVAPLEKPYFTTGFGELVSKRVRWLVILFVGGLFTTSTMQHYTNEFDTLKTLMWFVPLIISAGGNAGSQSATLMIRALAVGDVQTRDLLKVVTRESAIGLALGLCLAVVGAGRVLLTSATRTTGFIATVSLSVVLVVTISAVVGSGLPIVLRRLGLDPAVSSTPFIASLVDVVGLVMYFEIARLFLL